MPFIRNNLKDTYQLRQDAYKQFLEDQRLAANFGRIGIETIARGFAKVTSFAKSRDIPARSEEPPEAYIRWGKESDFDKSDTTQRDNLDVTVTTDDEDKNSLPPITYSEIARSTYTEKFFNPGDPTQWVEVNRARSARFSNPDEDTKDRDILFNLSTPG